MPKFKIDFSLVAIGSFEVDAEDGEEAEEQAWDLYLDRKPEWMREVLRGEREAEIKMEMANLEAWPK